MITWNGLMKITSGDREEWLNPGYIDIRKEGDVFELLFASADMRDSVTIQLDKKSIEDIADKIKEILKPKESQY